MKTLRQNRPVRMSARTPRRDMPRRSKRAAAKKNITPKFRLKKILVPTDFSDCSARALDYALAFAKETKAELILLHVVEPMIYPTLGQEIPVVLSEYQQDTVEVSRKQLVEVRKEKIADEVPAEILALSGNASAVIVDTAKSNHADLIIIGTHGYTGLKHVLLGSTAERVVRHARCPVLTVRGPEKETK